MVKVRHSTQAKKENGSARTILSFSNFRRSFSAPRGACDGVETRIPSNVENANARAGLNATGTVPSEKDNGKHTSHRCFFNLGMASPDENKHSQISRVLHEIYNSTKQDAEPSPATQLAAAFNRWRYSHLKVEERLYLELLKATHRAEMAESVVQEKDKELQSSREDLRNVEEEKCQIVSKLKAKNALLQSENDFCYWEIKNVVDQLAGICGEVSLEKTKSNDLGSYLQKQRMKPAKEVRERVYCLDEQNLSEVDFSLEVSLYNELQKLQDLIMREARFHEEQVREKDGSHEDEGGTNASPFSTSLCRICNGLAHCLLEARKQISALAGNSECQTCPTTAKKSKPRVTTNPTTLEPETNRGSDASRQNTRSKFPRNDPKSKKQKSCTAETEFQFMQRVEKSEIFKFVDVDKARRQAANSDEADCKGGGSSSTSLQTSKVHGHSSFSELNCRQSVSSCYT